ncbi:rod shape-determining protein MreD [Streptomyces sp. NPDC048483]|uniref:rod shape-determining protein MreD n=1 Tax=Streptomyces sp. NPDC048483 TaxID=3154927 RepID=UPI00343E1306
MRINRILLATPMVVVALVIQVSVLARLQLPGAVPDLLLLVVLGLALVYGHVGGCLVGFFAGLLADLAPPSDHAIGRYALVLCVIGYIAGLTRPDSGQHRSATVPLMVVIGAAIGSTLMYAGVGALVGDTAARHVGLVGLLLSATLYDLLLAPFIVPLVMAVARRTDNDPLAADGSGGSSGSAGGRDPAYGWLSTGTGFTASRGGMKKAGRIGRTAKAARIKGVKRL